jgi:enoyl-CoA hydratase/carnithine racemase
MDAPAADAPQPTRSQPFRTLLVEAAGPVGRLTLNRPERLNALSREVLEELVGAARWFDAQPHVKAVVVTGAGRAFSAGFDLNDFVAPDPAHTPRDTADAGRRMAEAIEDMRAVTVAAIAGHCVGGGVVLAAACDLRLAAEGATFSIPEVALGIPLAWGGIPRLVRELGPAITRELVLTCRPFDAGEAHRLRFVNRVVPAEGLDAAATELAADLAERSGLVLTMTKRAVQAAAEDLASTAGAGTDADLLVAAGADPESRAAGARYLEARGRRG